MVVIADQVGHKESAGVSLGELTRDLRLEASAYGITARNVRAQLSRSGYPLIRIYGGDGFAVDSHNAFHFKRNFVESNFGVPFMGSSDIISIDFQPTKHLSKKNTKKLDRLMIDQWDVLVSCSGTVGNVALAPPEWIKYAVSQHVLRIRFASPQKAGYAACFLRSRWGRAQTVGSQYGSVISHIEPEHLEHIFVPLLPVDTMDEIGDAFCKAASNRSEANNRLRRAENMFATSLGLNDLPSVPSKLINTIKLSSIESRLDANFHSPISRLALDALRQSGVILSTVGETSDVEIHAVTRFRERVYARVGIPFNASKEILQIDPIGMKLLAPNLHKNDMEEIGLRRGMVAVTCSGTLGRILHVPAYMEGWGGSQDFLRIIAPSFEDGAYLAAWLGSPYAQAILRRFSYGSIIRHIDKFMLSAMPIPVMPSDAKEAITSLSAEATILREQAWSLEQDALKTLERCLLSAA